MSLSPYEAACRRREARGTEARKKTISGSAISSTIIVSRPLLGGRPQIQDRKDECGKEQKVKTPESSVGQKEEQHIQDAYAASRKSEADRQNRLARENAELQAALEKSKTANKPRKIPPPNRPAPKAPVHENKRSLGSTVDITPNSLHAAGRAARIAGKASCYYYDDNGNVSLGIMPVPICIDDGEILSTIGCRRFKIGHESVLTPANKDEGLLLIDGGISCRLTYQGAEFPKSVFAYLRDSKGHVRRLTSV